MDTEPIQRWQKFLAAVLGTAVATICFDVPTKRAAAQYHDEVMTTSTALVCTSPFNYKEADLAVIANDQKWLKSLGCILARGGIPATVIERVNSPGYLWKVRLRPVDSEGVTVWGRHYSFASLGGERLDHGGNVIRTPRPQQRTPDPVSGPPGPVKDDTWFFQGSSMRLTEDGKRRTLAYEIPKTTMLRLGVRKGTVFFVGEQEGRSFRGTAHAFYQGCAPLPYQVEGEISENNRHLSLKGKLPQVDGSCNVQSYKDDIIELKQHEATAIIR